MFSHRLNYLKQCRTKKRRAWHYRLSLLEPAGVRRGTPFGSNWWQLFRPILMVSRWLQKLISVLMDEVMDFRWRAWRIGTGKLCTRFSQTVDLCILAWVSPEKSLSFGSRPQQRRSLRGTFSDMDRHHSVIRQLLVMLPCINCVAPRLRFLMQVSMS